MASWNNEAEARKQIKDLVAQYYHDFKDRRKSLSRVIEFPMHQEFLMRKKCRHSQMQLLTSGSQQVVFLNNLKRILAHGFE